MMIIEHHFYKFWLGIFASLFLGMTYIVAGSGKWFAGVVDFELLPTIEALEGLAHPWFLSWEITIGIALIKILHPLLTPMELALGILLVLGIFVKPLASFSLLLTAVFITNNIILISLGLGGEPCGCFGMGQKLTVIGSLFLDGVMAGLAVTILVLYPGRFFNKRPWFWGK